MKYPFHNIYLFAFPTPPRGFRVFRAVFLLYRVRRLCKFLKRSLDNVMKAIEEGIFTATTKQRMQDLENELALLDEKIVIEEYKAQNQLTREEVFQFLLHTARKEPNLMIHSFVQRAILSDDKIEIYYNFTNKQ